tara:strand:- start:11230 stop:11775 length:546 start_codon:yes stop_codon:yes gene_type:complete
MNFCSNCGSKTEKKIPPDDNRIRDCCDNCNSIFYSNPKIIVGTIPVKDKEVLLCKRAIEPRYGLWTIPAGFLENGETVEEGSFRETKEETGTEVKMANLYTIFNIPQINQVYMIYLAYLVKNDFGPTTESLEVKLFQEREIPWDQLAFPFVPSILKKFFQDIEEGNDFPLSISKIERPNKN